LKRRNFLKTCGVGAAATVASTAAADTRPNLLVIHTDQQSQWTVSAYGKRIVETPHIDSLAKDGALLHNFFTNSAVCTPSRGCFLTGRYPHAHGAYKNNIPMNRDEQTFASVLRDAGYDTGYAGKWHLDGEPKPGWVGSSRAMGFTDSRYMFNRGHYKQVTEEPGAYTPTVYLYGVMGDEETFTTDWLAEKTNDFLRRDRNRPFCFMVSIPDPHTPFTVRKPYDTQYNPADMPIPSTLKQKDLPRWAKRDKKIKDEAWLQKQLAQYCGEVKCIDDSVGRMLDCLRETGQLDNTIVVFTTDHGEYMGEHGLMHKNQIYETAYRLPFLIRWPEKIKSGTVVRNVVSTVDFQPTILNLMGVKPCGREQGYDASPLLRSERHNWDDVSWLHHSSLDRAGVFTPDYELAYVQNNDAVLFDRKNDPDQVRNLFNDAGHQKVIKELTARIVEHNIAVDAPAAKWLRQM
jgi:arylsulfatase A-like enzyme